MKYVTLHKSESHGADGMFGLHIEVAATHLPILTGTQIWNATHEAARLIESEIMAAIKENNPKTAEETARNAELLSLFEEPIFIEEIPNGYCKDWCCRHLPWFVVTTRVGRIKIGWRKRVINIDWSDTRDTKNSMDMFSKEDTTKGNKYIHAWSLEKAREYVVEILKRC